MKSSAIQADGKFAKTTNKAAGDAFEQRVALYYEALGYLPQVRLTISE